MKNEILLLLMNKQKDSAALVFVSIHPDIDRPAKPTLKGLKARACFHIFPALFLHLPVWVEDI